MADVIWLKRARKNLDQIIASSEVSDPHAADCIADKLRARAESLGKFPQRRRPASQRMRELVTVSPYILRYPVFGNKIVIVSIRHSARRPLDNA